MAEKKKPSGGASSSTSKSKKTRKKRKSRAASQAGTPDLGQFMLEAVTSWTQSALDFAAKSSSVPGRLAGALFIDPKARDELKPEYLQLMADAGSAIKDARRVAGLTLEDVNEALNVKNGDLLGAVESGTATLSFDLILRLASLLARHDPLPFVLKLARAYNPQAWQVLEGWGVGKLQIQLQREREFINVYRQHDEAREMTDEEFARVLAFTEKAFEMALAFRRSSGGEDDDESSG